ncbi:TPA: RloB domain-containing protein [Vibrio vulnificus]|nr:RloB domain-containing protein [Vibrio vulnificus]HDY8087070.1 RloB domain-containing protein [Vibrio vulnificus]HDY8109729.1 RloB domain-containing protein [Vibrio vulnificus]
MGSDNLFHKLKAKGKNEKKREHDKKMPYPKFLIVCEDTVSGYHYLMQAVNHYKLSTANFCIVGLGQDPLSLVLEAENRYESEKTSIRPEFDFVFCVFDRDTHSSYYPALSKIQSINKKLEIVDEDKNIFVAINSDPCFEIWLILHYIYTAKVYAPSQNKSAANNVVSDLKSYISDYDKSAKSVFTNTHEKLPTAFENASKLQAYCESHYVTSPCTKMNVLMEFIGNLR